ncbi:MAG: uroporphyrinogen-III synthase [Burkholderiales bacterium]|nr:uroporphyrinogen-III synthase [Burkholderiales bacterium]
MTHPLVLTRPAAQAVDWARQLEALGVEVRSCPLIDIEPDPPGCAAAWAAWPETDAAFFSSPAAVAAMGDGPWERLPLAACVGPGTAAALRAAGAHRVLSPPHDAKLFDSEHLWPLLQEAGPWSGRRWLWLRGEGGRDWLMQRLQDVGAVLRPIGVYHRMPPRLSAEELVAALAHPGLWLFSSSEAMAHLAQRCPRQLALHPPAALATHPRIVEAAERLGMKATLVRAEPLAVAQAWRDWCARMTA